MYNFFNNTTNQHHDHDHDHGTAALDVDPNDRNNSNSESMHDNQKRNQHKPEKELKDMNRIIKNNIAPLLIGFAVSMMFSFSLPANAADFDRADFRNTDIKFNAVDNFRLDRSDYDRDVRQSNRGRLIRSNFDNIDNRNKQDFDRTDAADFDSFRNSDRFDVNDRDFARRDFDRITDDRDRLARFSNVDSLRDADDIVVDIRNDRNNARDTYRDARANLDNVDDLNTDSFRKDIFEA